MVVSYKLLYLYVISCFSLDYIRNNFPISALYFSFKVLENEKKKQTMATYPAPYPGPSMGTEQALQPTQAQKAFNE